MAIKKFEKEQLDWWCNHYRICLRDLAKRTRQYLNGNLDRGVLLAFLDGMDSSAGDEY
jgi:hypothetical protein